MLWCKARPWGGLSRKVSEAPGEYLASTRLWLQLTTSAARMALQYTTKFSYCLNLFTLASSFGLIPLTLNSVDPRKSLLLWSRLMWALWERHSCRLWEPVGFCSQNDLFITCVYNAHCKEVWLWPTDVRHRCQVNMNGEGQACYSNGSNKKKITIIRKIFVITKEFLACAHQSPLWQALKEKRLWEKEKREKIMGRGREGWRERLRQWILLTCHSTTLAFN